MWNIVDDSIQKYRGLSTDTKPAAAPGSEFLEMDTGKTFLYDADGENWTEQPASGGGKIETVKPSDVNFYDCDGNRRYAMTAAEFAELEALPKNPAYPGLTPQGWNWTLSAAKTYVAANGKLDIGQMYITDDNATRFYTRHGKDNVYICFTVTQANSVEQDWETWQGDPTGWVGGINECYCGYSAAGEHLVKLKPTSGSMSFGGDSNYSIFGKNPTSASGSAGRQGNFTRIEMGQRTKNIGSYAFQYSLAENIVLRSGIESIGQYSFSNCMALRFLVIPSGITSIDTYAFQTCYSLKGVILPAGVTSIGTYAFQNCYSLAWISIPSGVTTISNSSFSGCRSLREVTIPASVTTIGSSAFASCSGVRKFIMKPTTPPTIQSNTFSNIHSDCKIIVPKSENQAVLNAYKSATNWSSHASKMEEEA